MLASYHAADGGGGVTVTHGSMVKMIIEKTSPLQISHPDFENVIFTQSISRKETPRNYAPEIPTFSGTTEKIPDFVVVQS